jgi:hypothetical protein
MIESDQIIEDKNMKILTTWQALRFLRFIAMAIKTPYAVYGKFKYIFIFSHMRGYTSLLAHILGSHPQISGYFELHRGYTRPFDFFPMRLRVADGLGYDLKGNYILDKILHRYEIAPGILQRRDVFCIFMLRKPGETLKSIMERGRLPGLSHALNYYVKQLKNLKNLSVSSKNFVYLDSESLLENTGSSLNTLSTFLGLQTELLPSFSTFKYTGIRGYGDSSTYIREGVILRQRDSHENFVIPDDILKTAESAYLETRYFLRTRQQAAY